VSCRRLIEVNLNTIRHQLRHVSTITEPPLRTFGDAAQLTAGAVHIFDDVPGAVDRLVNVAGTRRIEHTVGARSGPVQRPKPSRITITGFAGTRRAAYNAVTEYSTTTSRYAAHATPNAAADGRALRAVTTGSTTLKLDAFRLLLTA
jgi:hypothetical protein